MAYGMMQMANRDREHNPRIRSVSCRGVVPPDEAGSMLGGLS
jgi:hypothetical protein